MTTVVAIIMVLIFAVYIFRNDGWLIIRAKRDGIETKAYVSRIEKVKRTANGMEFPRRFLYVRYLRQDGMETEARVLNPRGTWEVGAEVRIRYLEDRSDCAVQVG